MRSKAVSFFLPAFTTANALLSVAELSIHLGGMLAEEVPESAGCRRPCGKGCTGNGYEGGEGYDKGLHFGLSF